MEKLIERLSDDQLKAFKKEATEFLKSNGIQSGAIIFPFHDGVYAIECNEDEGHPFIKMLLECMEEAAKEAGINPISKRF